MTGDGDIHRLRKKTATPLKAMQFISWSLPVYATTGFLHLVLPVAFLDFDLLEFHNG